MTDEEMNKVVDRLLFAVLTIPVSERRAFVEKLADSVLAGLVAKGYGDAQILVARQQFTQMVGARMKTMRANIPHGEGHA
jgi:hypothetical protein